jgi:TFIIF-interacting CTD phosphatase-like protein
MASFYKTALDGIPFKALTNKCIVLDLDETLVHSNENMAQLKELEIMSDPNLIDLRRRTYQITLDDVVYKKGEGVKTTIWGILRPHVREFLVWCFAYFKVVIVWSAGKRKYVDAIVDFLFKDIRRPHVVYSYDQCERTSNNLLVKPLTKMIQNVPGLSKYMSLENSFIIDDRNTVYAGYIGDNPDNGIQIPSYSPAFNIHSLRSDDIALKQLMTWMLRPDVMNSTDVRELDKSEVFKTNITTTPLNKLMFPQISEDDNDEIDENIPNTLPISVQT